MIPEMLKHLSGENIGRFPVWMMRQAGRYLPSYRAIREKHTFWEMVTDPALAAQVSLTPVEVLPVDGVIFFSDILTLPHSLKLGVEMQEKVGPVIPNPLRAEKDFSVFEIYDPAKHTPYIGETLRNIRSQIPQSLALLGFAGAPWTVASYLIEGKANREFGSVKGWMHSDPSGLTRALEMLARATVKYLRQQREAGVHIVQLFDTWIGEMPREFFLKHYVSVLETIFTELKKDKLPTIYFTKGAHHLMEDFERLSVDGLSVDSLLPLTEVERKTGGKFFLQGNLDPILLLKGSEGLIRRETRMLVEEAKKLKRPAIINLGHGILPQTPVENARAFVTEARTLWV
jgi:uroporphyrinogen decarboxylase